MCSSRMTAGPTAACADETGILQRGKRRELGGNAKRHAKHEPGGDDAHARAGSLRSELQCRRFTKPAQ